MLLRNLFLAQAPAIIVLLVISGCSSPESTSEIAPAPPFRAEKALFATDELSGFITAVALVRPSKSLSDTTPKSVKKKMKDKAFARAINREDIIQGAEELSIDLDELIQFVIDSLKPVSNELGLAVS